MGSVEGCDDQESVCSSNEREGDAFPKAFDRDLVTPTNLQKTHTTDSSDSTVSALTTENTNKSIDAETKDLSAIASTDETVAITPTNTGTGNTSTPKTATKSNSKIDTSKLGRELRTLEERRRSLLDHHWAVPSKERYFIFRSFSNKYANNKTIKHKFPRLIHSKSVDDDSVETIDTIVSIPSTSGIVDANSTANNIKAMPNITASIASISIDNEPDPNLTKPSCHDSGIDIRDINLPSVLQTKKNYSDADIVLSSDWVPPITIAPTDFTDTPPRGSSLGASVNMGSDTTLGTRKKTSSVSFSVDENTDIHQAHHHHSTSSDKSSDKKNKMLKRLSYPLTWVEGLTGDVKPQDSTESAPNTGDSNQSVFSKVFSR